MNVSGNHGSRQILFDTDQKTVHKIDVDNLARSIETVLQSSSKIVVSLENKKLSVNQQITNMERSDVIHEVLSGKRAEVEFLRKEMARSSYEHANFKKDKLKSLTKEIDSSIKRIGRAKKSFVEGNEFVTKMRKVGNTENAEGSKSGVCGSRFFGMVSKLSDKGKQ